MVVLVCVTAVRHPIKSTSRGKGFFWLMTQRFPFMVTWFSCFWATVRQSIVVGSMGG